MSVSYLGTAFQSRIAKQITLWVFGSLLIIEVIILLPSYAKREAELLATQTSLITSSLETALNQSTTETATPQASEIARTLEHLKSKANILDYALLQQNGKGLEPHTASFEVTPQDIEQLLEQPTFKRIAQTYDTAIEFEDTTSPLTVVVRHDTYEIQQELNAYTMRMLAMIFLHFSRGNAGNDDRRRTLSHSPCTVPCTKICSSQVITFVRVFKRVLFKPPPYSARTNWARSLRRLSTCMIRFGKRWRHVQPPIS